MRPRQTVLFIVLLLATLGGVFTVFLPDSGTEGPSPSVRARLQPIVDAYRAREADAARGRFASSADMAALDASRRTADAYSPVFSSEQSQGADDEARYAVNAYADFVDSLVASKLRPIAERDRTKSERLTIRVAHSLAGGAGSNIAALKSLCVQLALFVLFPLTFVVAFGPLALRAFRSTGLRRSGRLMHGVVVSSAPTGMMTNYVPEHRATIRLDDGGTSTATLLSYTGLPAGADVMVKVNPNDRRTAIVDSLKADGAPDYAKL